MEAIIVATLLRLCFLTMTSVLTRSFLKPRSLLLTVEFVPVELGMLHADGEREC